MVRILISIIACIVEIRKGQVLTSAIDLAALRRRRG